MRSFVTWLILLLLCASCIGTAGHPWEHDALIDLRAGETTEREAIELLGTPTSRSNFGEGGRILVFQHVRTFGPAVTEAKTVSLRFQDGTLVEVVSAVNLCYLAQLTLP